MKTITTLFVILLVTACGGQTTPPGQEPSPMDMLSGSWTAVVETRIAVGDPIPPVSYVARLEVLAAQDSSGQIAVMNGLCEPKPPTTTLPSWSQPPKFAFKEPGAAPYWTGGQPVRCVQTAFMGCEYVILYINDMYVESVNESEFSITGSGSAVGCNAAKRTLFTLRGVKSSFATSESINY